MINVILAIGLHVYFNSDPALTPLQTRPFQLAKMQKKIATETMGRGRVANARWERVPHSGGCNTETAGGKCSANTRNGQQVIVCRAYRERVGVW